jgi:uncharacterized protein YbjT (DUF2867 family)
MNMYTILGATGNVGSKLADILVRSGEDVRLVSRSADRLLPSLIKKARADVTYVGEAHSYVGDIMDTEFLVRAVEGSEAVFTLLPPNLKAEKFMTYADKIGGSIARALELAKIRHVVNLSSIGAELSQRTGLILGLHDQEERLNRIKDLNVLHVRASYFMENQLVSIDLIRSKGINGTAIRGDIKIPMIATRDIAEFVAERLVKRNFTGVAVEYLLGQRDLSLIEATSIIGSRIGKPELKYIMFPYDEAEKGLAAAGLSPDMSRLYVEMSKAFNEGRIVGSLKRTKINTTFTSFEKFCDDVLVPLYMQKKAA